MNSQIEMYYFLLFEFRREDANTYCSFRCWCFVVLRITNLVLDHCILNEAEEGGAVTHAGHCSILSTVD